MTPMEFLGMRPVGMFLINHERPGAIGIEIIRYLFEYCDMYTYTIFNLGHASG